MRQNQAVCATTIVLAAGLACAGPTGPDLLAAPDDPDGAIPTTTVTLGPDELGLVGSMLGFGDGPASRMCLGDTTINTAPEGDTPSGVAFTPDGSRYLIAHRDTRNVLVYDAATNTLIADIALSGAPNDLAISADSTRAVTANILDDTASIIDLSTNSEIAVVAVGDGPAEARITPDSSTALIGSLASGDLSVIDLATNTELRRIGGLSFFLTLSVNFEAFAVSSAMSNPFEVLDNTTIIHPDRGTDRILFVDITTGAMTALPALADPGHIKINTAAGVAVVTHLGTDDFISVLDTASQTITKTIAIPSGGPSFTGALAINGAGDKAAVAIQNAAVVVDLVTNAVSPSLNTASVNQMRTTADGNRALAVGFRGSLIDFATSTLIANTNNVVSAALGATAPIGDRAVMCSTTFGDDKVVVSTAAAGASLIDFSLSGPLPEGDKPRSAGVSPDGTLGLVTGNFSDNVTIYDLTTGTKLAQLPVGVRPGEVVVSPDSTTAVVANRDSSFATIIDLSSLTTTNVNISSRGDQVAISPDNHFAYIAVVVSDGIWRIDLTTNTIAGPKLPTGQMGGIGGAGNQISGMALSADGSSLAACNSFDDTITLIDATSWASFTTVAVGDFPSRATYTPDGTRLLVSNRSSNTVSIIDLTLAVPVVVATVPVTFSSPFEIAITPDSATAFVITADFNFPAIDRIDIASGTVLGSTLLPDPATAMALSATGDQLFVSTGNAFASTAGGLTLGQNGALVTIDTTSGAITDTQCLDRWPADMALSPTGRGILANLAAESATILDLTPPCQPDLTASTDPNDPGFGVPDGILDANDFFFYLGLFSAGAPAADLTGSINPNDPSFGIPDGTIDANDFFFYLDLFAQGCP